MLKQIRCITIRTNSNINLEKDWIKVEYKSEVNVSIGEVVDKITILNIKIEKIKDKTD